MRKTSLFLSLLAALVAAGLIACSGAQQSAPGSDSGPGIGTIVPGANPLGGGEEPVDTQGPTVVPDDSAGETPSEEQTPDDEGSAVEIVTDEASIDKLAYTQEFYSQSFRARGGSGDYDWGLSGNLEGLGLGEPTTALGTRKFEISGTPTEIGVHAITITVKDKANAALTDSLTFSLEVAESPNAMKTMSLMDLCNTPPMIEVAEEQHSLQLGDTGQRIALRINGGKPPYSMRIASEAVADSWHCHEDPLFGSPQESEYFFPDSMHHEGPGNDCEWTQNTTWRVEPDPRNPFIFYLKGDLKYDGPFNPKTLRGPGGIDDLSKHPQDILQLVVTDQCAERAHLVSSGRLMARQLGGTLQLKLSLQYPNERLDHVKVRMRYNQNGLVDISCNNDLLPDNCLGTWVDLFSGPYLAIYLQAAKTEEENVRFLERAYPIQCPEAPTYSSPMEIRTDTDTKADAYFRLARLEESCPLSQPIPKEVAEAARCDEKTQFDRQHAGMIRQVKEVLLLWGAYDWCVGKNFPIRFYKAVISAENPYTFNLRGLQFTSGFWGASYDDDGGSGGDKFSSFGSWPGEAPAVYISDRDLFPGMSPPNSDGGVFHRLEFPTY